MGNATGKGADGLMLLGMLQLCLQQISFCFRLFALTDVTGDSQNHLLSVIFNHPAAGFHRKNASILFFMGRFIHQTSLFPQPDHPLWQKSRIFRRENICDVHFQNFLMRKSQPFTDNPVCLQYLSPKRADNDPVICIVKKGFVPFFNAFQLSCALCDCGFQPFLFPAQNVFRVFDPQHHPYSGCKLKTVNRFGNEIIRAGFQSCHLQRGAGSVRCKENDGNMRCFGICLETAAHLYAVHARHLHIYQCHIRQGFGCKRQAGCCIRRSDHFASCAVFCNQLPDNEKIVRFVINRQKNGTLHLKPFLLQILRKRLSFQNP